MSTSTYNACDRRILDPRLLFADTLTLDATRDVSRGRPEPPPDTEPLTLTCSSPCNPRTESSLADPANARRRPEPGTAGLSQRECVSLQPFLVVDLEDDGKTGDLLRQFELVGRRSDVRGAGIVG